MLTRVTLVLFIALLASVFAPVAWAAEEITFEANDGVRVYADQYLSIEGKTAPLVILFHQAGSNARGEYGPIIPRLTELGFNVLAVDARSGGGRFGSSNRTVEALGKKTKYCPAYLDMEATLGWVSHQGFTGQRFIWGSSYSAALVLKLGIAHPETLSGVLSFSPANGAAMGACGANQFIDHINVPTLALSPQSEMRGRKDQFARLQAKGHQTYVAQEGVHGSSMLVEARTKADTSATWAQVIAFLKPQTGEPQ